MATQKELKEKARAAREKTNERRDVRAAKRSKRRKGEELAPLKRRPVVDCTVKDVKSWFDDGLVSLYGPDHPIFDWTQVEIRLVKKLLNAYGSDKVRQAVELFCRDWDRLRERSGGRLQGEPTINLLWGMRRQIFGELANAQRKQTVPGRDSDEYREDLEKPGRSRIGW